MLIGVLQEVNLKKCLTLSFWLLLLLLVQQKTYFWLWAGGRSDQVESAAFKQDIGHNPVEGLDRCAEAERIGRSLLGPGFFRMSRGTCC